MPRRPTRIQTRIARHLGRQLKVFTKKAEKDNKTLKYAKKRLGYGTEAPIHLDDDTVTITASPMEEEVLNRLFREKRVDLRSGRTSG